MAIRLPSLLFALLCLVPRATSAATLAFDQPSSQSVLVGEWIDAGVFLVVDPPEGPGEVSFTFEWSTVGSVAAPILGQPSFSDSRPLKRRRAS